MGELPKVYTSDEVAELLRVPVRTVQGYVRAGKLKPLVLGKYVRFTEEAVLDFMRSGADADGFARLSEKGRRNAARKRGAPAEDGTEPEPEPPAPEEPKAAAAPADFLERLALALSDALKYGVAGVEELEAGARASWPADEERARFHLRELEVRTRFAATKAQALEESRAGNVEKARELLDGLEAWRETEGRLFEGLRGNPKSYALARALYRGRPKGDRPKTSRRKKSLWE